MDTRVAQKALNFFLSDRFTFKGTDALPLLEIVTRLQQEINNGPTTDTQGGDTPEPSPGP